MDSSLDVEDIWRSIRSTFVDWLQRPWRGFKHEGERGYLVRFTVLIFDDTWVAFLQVGSWLVDRGYSHCMHEIGVKSIVLNVWGGFQDGGDG